MGSTACSCSDLLKSAEATYGSTTTFTPYLASTPATITTLSLPLPTSYIIPENCCVKCGVTANEVRLLYWPIETDAKNATSNPITTAPIPYTLVSEGFTL